MSSSDFTLTSTPPSGRQRELWLQHAAGLIVFEDVRGYAIENLDLGLDETTRAIAIKAIDDAVYGLMMVFDGVSGSLANAEHAIELRTTVRLTRRQGIEAEVVEQLELRDGDGMCMGFHGWREGDFGRNAVTKRPPDRRERS